MKNIAILLLVFILGFGIASGIYSPIHKEHQVKEELITKWKGQWCNQSCGIPVLDIGEVCSNYLGELREKEIIKAQREASIWFDGVKEGHRRR
jgi:hypothetical protein